MRMYVRKKGGYGAFPLMTEVTSIHAPKIMKSVRLLKNGQQKQARRRARLYRYDPPSFQKGRPFCFRKRPRAV